MKIAESLLHNLIALARIDRNFAAEEQRLIERYRKALAISSSRARSIARRADAVIKIDTADLAQEERRSFLRMMAEVAHADGRLEPREKSVLKDIAESLEIGQYEFADMSVDVVRRAESRRRLRTRQQHIVLSLIFLACCLALVAYLLNRDQIRATTQHQREFAEQAELIAEYQSGEKQRSAQDQKLVEASIKKQEVELYRLQKYLAELEGKSPLNVNNAAIAKEVRELRAKIDEKSKDSKKHDVELIRLRKALTDLEFNLPLNPHHEAIADEIRELRSKIEEKSRTASKFKEVLLELPSSVLLISSHYALVKGSHRVVKRGVGTGFVVSASGLVVTNKHVIEGWKFDVDDQKLIANGYTVDLSSRWLAAWPAGEEFLSATRRYRADRGFNLRTKTLEILSKPQDDIHTRFVATGIGKPQAIRMHRLGPADLAVLQLKTAAPMKPFPLHLNLLRLSSLDPVMVIGFPNGVSALEGHRAIVSPSLGTIRKVETLILVTAPIVPGNSGGPLVDQEGFAIGVASLIRGDSSMGGCIPVSHVIPLLPVNKDLCDRAEKFLLQGHPRAFLDELNLAGQRGAIPKKLLAKRKQVIDDLVEEFKKIRVLENDGRFTDARIARKSLNEQFGERWILEAKNR